MNFKPLETIAQDGIVKGDYVLIKETDRTGDSMIFPAIFGGVEQLTLPKKYGSAPFSVVRVFDANINGRYYMRESRDDLLWSSQEYERAKNGALLPLDPEVQKIVLTRVFSTSYEYVLLKKNE